MKDKIKEHFNHVKSILNKDDSLIIELELPIKHLQFSTNPINVGKEERISLSFNTFSIDILGSEDRLTHLDIRSLMNESN